MRILARKNIDSIIGAGIILAAVGSMTFPLLYLTVRGRDADTEIQALLDRYDRIRAIAQFDPAKVEDRDLTAAYGRVVLGQGPASVETSTLQAQLRDVAGQQGLSVLQASELKLARDESGVERLGIRLELIGPTAGVVGFLQQMETSQPWLFADNVQLRSGYLDASATPEEPPLSLGLDIWAVRIVLHSTPPDSASP